MNMANDGLDQTTGFDYVGSHLKHFLPLSLRSLSSQHAKAAAFGVFDDLLIGHFSPVFF
jgi:hypothetical protein